MVISHHIIKIINNRRTEQIRTAKNASIKKCGNSLDNTSNIESVNLKTFTKRPRVVGYNVCNLKLPKQSRNITAMAMAFNRQLTPSRAADCSN